MLYSFLGSVINLILKMIYNLLRDVEIAKKVQSLRITASPVLPFQTHPLQGNGKEIEALLCFFF